MSERDPQLLLQAAPFLRRGVSTPRLMVEVTIGLAPVIAAAVYFFFVLLGYRQLGRTKDKQLQGPRWLWKALMPSSAVNVGESGVTIIPVGVALFWLFGRRRRRGKTTTSSRRRTRGTAPT